MSTKPNGVDDLIKRLRKKVDKRRDAGEYPEGLEEQLDEHFRRIVFHRAKENARTLDDAISRFDESIHLTPVSDAGVDPTFPARDKLRTALDIEFTRQRQLILDQVSELAAVTQEAVHALADAVKDPGTHVHADIIGRLDSILEQLSHEPIDRRE